MSYSLASPDFIFAIFLTVALLVVGCGNKDPETQQVIASVDGADINMRQMGEMLSNSQGVTPENISTVKLQILDTLVEQQLAVNLALSKKLDRKPEVLGAIEASRREILAQAVWDQIAADLPLVSEDDAKKYMADNPALFSERRIFSLQEITLKKASVDLNQIQTQVSSTKRLEDILAWLKDKKIEFDFGTAIRPAEQVPSAQLSRFQGLKEGQIILVDDADVLTVTRLVSVRSQPIPSAKALPVAVTFLSRQRVLDAISRAKLDMRTNAKLTYLGEFAGEEKAFKARAEADAKMAAAVDEHLRAKDKAANDALAEQMANQQADSKAEQDARDKARFGPGKWQAPTKAEAIFLEQGIKGL